VAFEVCTNPASGFSARAIVLRYSLTTGLTDIINTNATEPLLSFELIHNLSMTPDGRFVAYVAGNSTTNSIECWDAQTASNTLVSVSTDNSTPANGACDSPVISTNGQFVIFTSTGNNLVTNPLTGSCHVYLRDLQAGTTLLLDTDTNGMGLGVDATTVPAMSADGSVVAFDCANLLPDNRHLVHDVQARNVTSGVTSLVSAANPTLRSQTPDGISGFTGFSISSNGQFVAFYSDADNLVPGDTNGYRDVFLRDLIAGTDYLVSVNTNGNAPGDGISTDPAISGDGRYVAFTSSADNLVADDTNRAQDVFVRDLKAGTTTLVSISMDGVDPGNSDSYSPTMSADGRYVLFHSKASNLAAGSFGSGVENLFFRDQQAGITYPLTMSGVHSAGMTPDGQSVAFINNQALCVWNSQMNTLTYSNNSVPFTSSPFPTVAISPNGQKLAYVAGSPDTLYLADLVGNTVTSLLTSASIQSHANLQFSDDGRFLVYAAEAKISTIQNVYLYDSLLGTNLLVSQNFNGTGPANTNSDSPVISPDGRFVVYRSFASNIVSSDFNNTAGLFLYDVSSNATILISQNAGGNASADDRSLQPVFSADGQMLFFQSWASDIVSGGDFNNGSDLFAQDLVLLSLINSGVTNPTSDTAVQLVAPAPSPGFVPLINWPLAAGIVYQVQYKTNLTDPAWLNLPGNMTFIGATGWLSDMLPSSGRRFYRIALTPVN
jgi:Tol biopolymer transport system component